MFPPLDDADTAGPPGWIKLIHENVNSPTYWGFHAVAKLADPTDNPPVRRKRIKLIL
jgi:hypothetical protein